MKKLKYLLITLLLLLPLNVFADMGAPGLKQYVGIITNENGAMIYDYKTNGYKETGEVIPYNSEVTAEFEQDDFTTVQYNKKSITIKTSDITPKDKFDDSELKDETKKGIILAEEVSLREGPASSYKEIMKIKKGEHVTIHDSVADGSYQYISYKNKKGFVYSVKGTVGIEYGPIITMTGIDVVNEDGLSLINIPKFTEVQEVYKTDNWDGIQFYVSYNGKEGYLNTNRYTGNDNVIDPGKRFGTADSGYVEVQAGTKLYKDIDDKMNPTDEITTIEEDIRLDVIYYYGFRMNELGFVGGPGTEYTIIYVEYNGTKGWIKIDETRYVGQHIHLNEDFKLNEKYKTEEEKEKDKKEELKEKEKERDKAKEREKEANKLDNTTIIIMVICGTIVIVVTIIAIAVVVSKRRGPKEPNVIGPDVLASTTIEQDDEPKKTSKKE